MTDNVSAAQLLQFIERIETLLADKQGLMDDIKDVKAEAKGTGFDIPTLMRMIAIRAIEKAALQEQEALYEVYKSALGIAA